MTMMALDTLTVCLQATLRAGRAVGFSQAAVKSRKRAERLLTALEAMAPAQDDEEPVGLPALAQGVQVQAGPAVAENQTTPRRKQTGELVLDVLRAAGGQLPIAEVVARLPGHEPKNVRTAINGLQSRGKVQTVLMLGESKRKLALLTPLGWSGGEPAPAEWRRRNT